MSGGGGSQEGATLLIVAAWKGHLSMTRLLINKGADIHKGADISVRT